jgi:transketolase
LAGHLKLNKLIVLFDDNFHLHRWTNLALPYPTISQTLCGVGLGRGCGSMGTTQRAIATAIEQGTPLGPADADRLQNRHRLWGSDQARQGLRLTARPLGPDEIKGARDKLGWAHAHSSVPADVLGRLARGRSPRRRPTQGVAAAHRRARRGETRNAR